jgi:hypothetical protein
VGGYEGARYIADILEERNIERFAYVMDESAPFKIIGAATGVFDRDIKKSNMTIWIPL